MRRTVSIALAAMAFALLAFVPSAGAQPLKFLLAPEAACPGATELDAPVAVQEGAMRCLTDFARRHRGMHGLGDDSELDRSALHKSGDIIRCDSFSHYACGRDFTYWMQRTGYIPARCWRAAENIAWGTGSYGSARSIFNAWLHSPGHRENIMGPYGQIGVGLQVGGLSGHGDAHVWVQHFGSHCDERPSNDGPKSHDPKPHVVFHKDLGKAIAVDSPPAPPEPETPPAPLVPEAPLIPPAPETLP